MSVASSSMISQAAGCAMRRDAPAAADEALLFAEGGTVVHCFTLRFDEPEPWMWDDGVSAECPAVVLPEPARGREP